DPVSYDVVNLAPGNPITTHKVRFGKTIPYESTAEGSSKMFPATTFTDTEVYLDHVLSGPRTLLLGMKYTDAKTGKVYMQDTAGWLLQTDKGDVFYFMMGH